MSKPSHRAPLLDRYTTMGDFTGKVSRMLKRHLYAIAGVLALGACFLFYAGSPGALAFTLIVIGTVIAFAGWTSEAKGVPLLPMLVLQSLFVYGLPIISGHPIVNAYPADYLTQAGFEVLVFDLALVLAWKMAGQFVPLSRPQAYALQGIDRAGVAGLTRLGFGLAGAATLFLLLQSLDLTGFIFEILPSGSMSIVIAAVAVSSACGFFVLAMILGVGDLPGLARSAFWFLVALNCLISASSFLLSAAAVVLASVVIGLFWSSGRIPWRFVILIVAAVSFFNSGKYAMRGRYWTSAEEESVQRPSGFTGLPQVYAEWTQASWAAIVGEEAGPAGFKSADQKKPKTQGLLDRLNNLQNILYVIDAMDAGHVAALGGDTYVLIPPLLVPRILWPSKPRTHEGQVMLNVHFGRQDLQSTFKTYVAWGLLAEAYGNFGAIKGAVLLGLVLGIFFAWAEAYTAQKPLLSAEGFVSFVVFLGLANSFEMVASVMVTSIFQSAVTVLVACAPFVKYKTVVRPAPE